MTTPTDFADLLVTRLQNGLKGFLHQPDSRIAAFGSIRQIVNTAIAETGGNPFERKVDAMDFIIQVLKEHEKTMDEAVHRLETLTSGWHEKVLDKQTRPRVTVRSESRVTVREFPQGTVLYKTVHWSKQFPKRMLAVTLEVE